MVMKEQIDAVMNHLRITYQYIRKLLQLIPRLGD